MSTNNDKIIQPIEENTLVVPRNPKDLYKDAKDLSPSFRRAISNFFYSSLSVTANATTEFKSAMSYLVTDRLRGRKIKDKMKNLFSFKRKEKEEYFAPTEEEFNEKVNNALISKLKELFGEDHEIFSNEGKPSTFSQSLADRLANMEQSKEVNKAKEPLVVDNSKPMVESVVNVSEEVPVDIFENRQLSLNNTEEFLSYHVMLAEKNPVAANHLKPFIDALNTEKALLTLNDNDIDKGLYEAKFDSASFQNESLKPALRETLVGDSPDINQRVYKSQVDVALADMNKFYFAIENEPNPDMKRFWTNRLDSYMETNKEVLSTVLPDEHLRVTGDSLDERLENIQKTSKAVKQIDTAQQSVYQLEEGVRLQNEALQSLLKNPVFEDSTPNSTSLSPDAVSSTRQNIVDKDKDAQAEF